MCCALRQYLVTDFKSDHPFSAMCDRRSSSPHHRREDTFPLRTTLPSREPSKEDIELAQHLLGHSQAARNSGQTAKDSPSPTYELQSPGSKSPASERMHQFTPRSLSMERGQRESSQAYLSATTPPPNAIPSGQVCR
jgi:GATA-binding protein